VFAIITIVGKIYFNFKPYSGNPEGGKMAFTLCNIQLTKAMLKEVVWETDVIPEPVDGTIPWHVIPKMARREALESYCIKWRPDEFPNDAYNIGEGVETWKFWSRPRGCRQNRNIRLRGGPLKYIKIHENLAVIHSDGWDGDQDFDPEADALFSENPSDYRGTGDVSWDPTNGLVSGGDILAFIELN